MNAYDDALALNAETNAEYKRIKLDRTLSTAGKQKALAAAWRNYTARLPEISERYRREVDARRRTGTRMMADLLTSSKGDAVALRDAIERATKARNEDLENVTTDRAHGRRSGGRLLALLEQAEMTRDEDLARGVLNVAHKVGLPEVVDAYLASRPTARATYDKATASLAEAGTGDLTDTLFALSMPDAPL